MKNALIVATIYDFIGAFEKNDISILQKQGYRVHCAANMSKEIGELGDIGQLDKFDINKIQIDFERFPFSKSNIRAYKQLKECIERNNFDLIHCHTPVGGILARLAARRARKKGTKVIYTAHGFHFFKGASLLNWILYYPIEKICSYFTDVLITINKEDYALAKKNMKAKEVRYIPGVGVDTSKFADLVVNREKKREELGIPKNSILLLSVGELNKNKNHEVIIRALAKLNSPNVYYCIAGEGELDIYLKKLSQSLGIGDRVDLLGYRKDVGELYKTADIFCFPSHREGLSVALMEVMSAGLPVICSNIRGNIDLIQKDKGGYLCNASDIDEFRIVIDKLIDEKYVRNKMSEFNGNYVKRFDSDTVKINMKNIYGMNG